MPRAHRTNTDTINLDALTPELRRLIDALGRSEPQRDVADPVPPRAGQASSLSRLTATEGGTARSLTPQQWAAFGTPRPMPPELSDDDALWLAEEPRTRVGKEGVEFAGDHWWAPELMACVSGAARDRRPQLLVRYDALARAEGTLREVYVYQVHGTGERSRICRAVRRGEVTTGIDVAAFIEAREQQLQFLLAKRASARGDHLALRHGYDVALEELQLRETRARRERTASPEAEVASPVGAAEQSRARHNVRFQELYPTEPAPADHPAAPITRNTRSRRTTGAVPTAVAAASTPPPGPRAPGLPEAGESPATPARRRRNPLDD